MSNGQQHNSGGGRFANYAPLHERIADFYAEHRQGRILTSIIEHDRETGFILMRAEIYRGDLVDDVPAATGHAFENKTSGQAQSTSYIKAQTSHTCGCRSQPNPAGK